MMTFCLINDIENLALRILSGIFILGDTFFGQEVTPSLSKKLTRLAGSEIKSMLPTFKISMLLYQPKANLDVEILFGKIIHHLDSENRKMLVRAMLGNEGSTFHSAS